MRKKQTIKRAAKKAKRIKASTRTSAVADRLRATAKRIRAGMPLDQVREAAEKDRADEKLPVQLNALARQNVVEDGMIAGFIRRYLLSRAEAMLKRHSDDDLIQGRPSASVTVAVSPNDAGHLAAFALAVAAKEREAVCAIVEAVIGQRLVQRALENVEHAPTAQLVLSREEVQALATEIVRLVKYERGPFATEAIAAEERFLKRRASNP